MDEVASAGWLSSLESAVTICAVVLAALWFLRRRESHPRVDFDLELELLGIKDDHWLVAVIANVQNRGAVRHRVESFGFEIAALKSFERLPRGRLPDGQIAVTNVIRAGSWVRGHEYTFCRAKDERDLSLLDGGVARVRLAGPIGAV